MNPLKKFFGQCAKPEGFLGRVMLRFMNFGHAPLNNWGLGLIDIHDDWTILDIGCGGGATIKRLIKNNDGTTPVNPKKRVYGIDISKDCVEKTRKMNKEWIDKQVFVEQGSVEKLPYADNMFDLVTAVETVYFWPGLVECMKEVNRVMKPGAQFAVMVDVNEKDSKWGDIIDGMTVYSPEELKDMMEKAGFTDVSTHRKHHVYAAVIGKKI